MAASIARGILDLLFRSGRLAAREPLHQLVVLSNRRIERCVDLLAALHRATRIHIGLETRVVHFMVRLGGRTEILVNRVQFDQRLLVVARLRLRSHIREVPLGFGDVRANRVGGFPRHLGVGLLCRALWAYSL